MLVELRDRMAAELEETGKAEWARQEFDHLLGFEPAGPGRGVAAYLRACTGCAAAAPSARPAPCGRPATRSPRQRDVTPGRIIPDAAIVAAATAMPTDRGTLLGAPRASTAAAPSATPTAGSPPCSEARAMPEDELPTRAPRSDGPPHPRTWADRDPVADRRFKAARAAMLTLAEEHGLPVENLMTPDYVRRAMWTPPATREPADLAAALAAAAARYGARPWQVELVTPRAHRRGAHRRRAAEDRDEPTATAGRARRPTPPRRTIARGVGPSDWATRWATLGARARCATPRRSASVAASQVEDAGVGDAASSSMRARPPSRAPRRVEQRRHHHAADAELKTRACSRLPAGLQEVLGAGHLDVGRDDVAGAATVLDRRVGDGVDDEVGGRRGVLGRPRRCTGR